MANRVGTTAGVTGVSLGFLGASAPRQPRSRPGESTCQPQTLAGTFAGHPGVGRLR